MEDPKILSLQDLMSAKERRRTDTVYIRSLDGHVVLHELMAHDVVLLGEMDKAQQVVKARVCLTLKEPNLGMDLPSKLAALEQLLTELPEGAWDEITSAVYNFQHECLVVPTERLRQAIESVPELWKVLEVLDAKHGWFKDLEGVTLSEIERWLEFWNLQREKDNG